VFFELDDVAGFDEAGGRPDLGRFDRALDFTLDHDGLEKPLGFVVQFELQGDFTGAFGLGDHELILDILNFAVEVGDQLTVANSIEKQKRGMGLNGLGVCLSGDKGKMGLRHKILLSKTLGNRSQGKFQLRWTRRGGGSDIRGGMFGSESFPVRPLPGPGGAALRRNDDEPTRIS